MVSFQSVLTYKCEFTSFTILIVELSAYFWRACWIISKCSIIIGLSLSVGHISSFSTFMSLGRLNRRKFWQRKNAFEKFIFFYKVTRFHAISNQIWELITAKNRKNFLNIFKIVPVRLLRFNWNRKAENLMVLFQKCW